MTDSKAQVQPRKSVDLGSMKIKRESLIPIINQIGSGDGEVDAPSLMKFIGSHRDLQKQHQQVKMGLAAIVVVLLFSVLANFFTTKAVIDMSKDFKPSADGALETNAGIIVQTQNADFHTNANGQLVMDSGAHVKTSSTDNLNGVTIDTTVESIHSKSLGEGYSPVGYLPKSSSEAGWDDVLQGAGVMTTVSVGGGTQAVQIEAGSVSKSTDDDLTIYNNIVVKGDDCGTYRAVCSASDSCTLYRKATCDHHANRRFLESRASRTGRSLADEGLDEVYADGVAENPASAYCEGIEDSRVRSLCNEWGNVDVDATLECDNGQTFAAAEILKADDPAAALSAVLTRCGVDDVDGGRRLRSEATEFEQKLMGRKMLVNYGWCSIRLKFITSQDPAEDTADYCKGHRCPQSASVGCNTKLSRCCVVHDKCLQASHRGDSNGRCTKNAIVSGGACDRFLAVCAGRANCWRGHGFVFICWLAKTAVREVMGGGIGGTWGLIDRPNANHNGHLPDWSGKPDGTYKRIRNYYGPIDLP